MKNKIQRRTVQLPFGSVQLETREQDDALYLEGYFAVFNQETELWPGAFEKIAPGAFDKTMGNDIRCLINHDTTLVLGRNKANTMELKTDSYGLWACVKINSKDSDAMNAYERVKRGDVSGNSFGFNIISELTDWRDDGTVMWTLTEIDLHEISVVTFPAYEQTTVQARQKEVEQHKKRALDAKKAELRRMLSNA